MEQFVARAVDIVPPRKVAPNKRSFDYERDMAALLR
jgi:hypothetical protein